MLELKNISVDQKFILGVKNKPIKGSATEAVKH